MRVLPNRAGDGGGYPDTRDTTSLCPTPFKWMEPGEIPPRPWIYGSHLLRKNLAVTIAPGGVGKSSLSIVQAIELATGRSLLGHVVHGKQRVCLFNLEDDADELRRRLTAAMQYHGIAPESVEGRLYVDSGRDQELMLAAQERDALFMNEAVFARLEIILREEEIDVLIIDPFVSSHRVNEMDNGKIDAIAKRLVRLAETCNCAVEVIHHTRKLNGMEASSDASRGASSLVNAARSVRVLQRVPRDKLEEYDVLRDGCTYFQVKRDKANLALTDDWKTYRTVPVELGQGDTVGVVEAWSAPDLFENIRTEDVLAIQRDLEDTSYRYSDQAASGWAGEVVASRLRLDPVKDKKRLKQIIRKWLATGVLIKAVERAPNGKVVPVLKPGEWINAL